MSWIKLGFDAYGVDMVQTRQPDFVQNCAAFQQASEYLYQDTAIMSRLTGFTKVTTMCKSRRELEIIDHHFFSKLVGLKYFVVAVIPAENRTWLPDSTELEVFTRVHFTNTELELTFCCQRHRYEYVSSRTWRITSSIN